MYTGHYNILSMYVRYIRSCPDPARLISDLPVISMTPSVYIYYFYCLKIVGYILEVRSLLRHYDTSCSER